MTVDIKKLENSEIELAGEIAAADFESFRHEVMEEFRKKLELPGFRKGHAPDNMIIEKVSAEKIMYEMAEHALSHYYPEILAENKIDAIGRPDITITKIAAGNPLGFKIKTAVMPEIKLADYQKIAQKEMAKPLEDSAATDQEVSEVIEELRKNRAAAARPEGADPKEEVALPALDDEFAKSLGQFESLADLTDKIKDNLAHDKKHRAEEKKRLTIMEEIIAGTKMDLPQTLVEGELHKMSHEMRSQLEGMGLKYEDYLAHLKKTEEDLTKEWRPEAEKRAKFGLILAEIAKTEKITADPKDLEHEVSHIMEHYADADPARVRAYAESMLVNEGVFKFLENLK